MQTKHVCCDFLKSVSPQGTFEGLLAPYGNVDQGGDRVLPGAFIKNIRDKGPNRPLLWQHQTDIPIGKLTLIDSTAGLAVKGALLMELPEAQKAHALMKAGIVEGLSYGYRIIRDSLKAGVRELIELAIMEGSVVTLPMNEMALIQSVKAIDHDRLGLALKDFRTGILRALERK